MEGRTKTLATWLGNKTGRGGAKLPLKDLIFSCWGIPFKCLTTSNSDRPGAVGERYLQHMGLWITCLKPHCLVACGLVCLSFCLSDYEHKTTGRWDFPPRISSLEKGEKMKPSQPQGELVSRREMPRAGDFQAASQERLKHRQ